METKQLYAVLRQEQKKIVDTVISDLRTRDLKSESGIVYAINAPTGIGKTLCALYIASVLHEDHGLVTVFFTRTRSQMESVVRDTYKFFSRLCSVALNKTETCTAVRGADDVSALPCHECYRKSSHEVETIYNAALDIVRRDHVYDPYVIAERLCARYDYCPYTYFKKFSIVSRTPWAVYTYPYLLNDFLTAVMERGLDEIFRAVSTKSRDGEDGEDEEVVVDELAPGIVAVIDEAHWLETALLKPDFRITLATLDGAVAESIQAAPLSGKVHELGLRPEDVHRAVVEISRLLAELMLEETKQEEVIVPVHRLEEVFRPVEKLGIEVVDFLLILRDMVSIIYRRQRAEGRKPRSSLNVLAKFLAGLLLVQKRHQEYVVVSVAQDEKHRALEIRRCDPTTLYQRYLSRFRVVILLSGTLQDRDYIVNVWGVPEDKLVYVDLSDIRFGKVNLYVDTSVTSRFTERSDKMYTLYALKITEIYRRARRCVLVLTPSYQFAEEIYRRLPDDIRLFTVVEKRGARFGEIEERAKRGEKLLIIAVAGGKFSEGVELTDKTGRSLISDVVIAGIPYPRPTEFTKLVEERVLEKSPGLDRWYLLNTQAYVLVRQALGRSIRHPEDEANWWLLDARFYKVPYFREKLRLGLDNIVEIMPESEEREEEDYI